MVRLATDRIRKRRSIIERASNKTCKTKLPRRWSRLLGADHFRVGVSADVDITSGEQSEETFDPAKSVMVTSQKTRMVLRCRAHPAFPERHRICRRRETRHRGEQLCAPHREHHLSDQPVGETYAIAARRGEEACRSQFWWITASLGRYGNEPNSLRSAVGG